ncbi:MAG: hypothetical protein Q8N17_11770, partial [Burkholderiaceae bacterium]|nr:hypothetical protein [Burkholderiaceae bacterium]
MTIQLKDSIFIAGAPYSASSPPLTLGADVEAELVNRGVAVYTVQPVTPGGGLVPAMSASNLDGLVSLQGPDNGLITPLSHAPDINFNDVNWRLITDFNDTWTANAACTTALVDGGKVGQKCRTLNILSSGPELTSAAPLPVAQQFVLNDVKTVGLLFEADEVTIASLDVYFANTSFVSSNNRAWRIPVPAQTPGGLMFVTGHVDRVAAESPGGTAPWAAGFTGAFTNITDRIRIAPGLAAGTTIKLHGLFVGGKSKPKMMVGFD